MPTSFEMSDKIRDERDKEFLTQFDHLKKNMNIPLKASESVVQIQEINGYLHVLTNHGRIWKLKGWSGPLKNPIPPHWELIHEHPLHSEKEDNSSNDGTGKDFLGSSVGTSTGEAFKSRQTPELTKISWKTTQSDFF